MNIIPFAKQKLVLKQVNLAKLTAPGQDVMEHLFGQFALDTMPADERTQASKRMAELLGQPPDKIKSQIDDRPSRRYAGDDTLPRGRYYSIANDLSGNDEYTLLSELLAYAKPDNLGFFQLFDLTILNDRNYIQNFFAQRYQASYTRDDVFLIGLLPLYGRSHELVENWNKTKERIPLPVYVEIPLTMQQETIDKVIDLRDPTTADWFAKEISSLKFDLKGEQMRCFLGKPVLKNFKELIPTLLEQNLGGGWNFCKLAGYHLRKLGANGLIYPSARCDVQLEISGDKIQKSKGWNFVDYRGAPNQDNWIFFDLDTSWQSHVAFSQPVYGDASKNLYYKDVMIHYTDHGMQKGSWSIEGLKQWQEAWYQTMMVENLLKFRDIKFYEKVFPPILDFLCGQPDGAYHFGTADAFVDALRGSPERLNQLTELTQRLSEKEKYIKEALLDLVTSTVNIINDTSETAKLESSVPLAILKTGR